MTQVLQVPRNRDSNLVRCTTRGYWGRKAKRHGEKQDEQVQAQSILNWATSRYRERSVARNREER